RVRPSDLVALHPFPTRRSSDLQPKNCRSEVFEARIGCIDTPVCEQDARHQRRVHAMIATPRFVILLEYWSGCTADRRAPRRPITDRKSTRLNSSHPINSYAVFC